MKKYNKFFYNPNGSFQFMDPIDWRIEQWLNGDRRPGNAILIVTTKDPEYPFAIHIGMDIEETT